MKATAFSVFLLFLLGFSCSAYAEPSWHFGTVNRIWTFDTQGDFILTFNSSDSSPSSLSGCKWGYAYFTKGNLGEEGLKRTYAMALSAFYTGTKVGIVMDSLGDGSVCNAMSLDVRK